METNCQIESLNATSGRNGGARTSLASLAKAGKTCVTVDKLVAGENDKIVTALRVVKCISILDCPPESFLCVDAKGNLCILSVYKVSKNEKNHHAAQFGSESIVTIENPVLLAGSETSSSGENKENSGDVDESIDYYDDGNFECT